ncbi:MAG TPA: hypothetical protein VKU92_02655 [Acidimicrobiales bacterium]|nr:hypothetical protein [Acidimicrobiales bacterium]
MRRTLSLVLVGATLVALLVAGALTTGGRRAPRPRPPGSLLAAVDLSRAGASVWDCPGPLTISARSSAQISLLNPSDRRAEASILVAEVAVSAAHPEGRALPARTEVLQLPAHSEREVPVPVPPGLQLAPAAGHHPSGHGSAGSSTSAPPSSLPTAVEAAVGVTVTGPAVAVSETDESPSGVLETPCATGSGRTAYTASGVTAGSSTVEAALFDPTDAPAVVNLTVGTPSGSVQPAAYQGIEVAPRSLVLVDLGRYVPLRSHLAIAATATVGTIVLGSLTTLDETVTTGLLGPGHSYLESGVALAVGIGRPLTAAVMPLGAASPSISEGVQLFDPGSRPAAVRVSTTVAGAGSASLTVEVAPGATVTVDAPVAGKGTALGGALSVASTHGVGIVVSHETYRRVGIHQVVVSTSAVVAGGAGTWLLPGIEESAHVSSRLVLTSTGRSTEAVIEALSASSGQRLPALVGRVRVPAGASVVVRLARLVRGHPGSLGLEVRAGSPLLVESMIDSVGNEAPTSAVGVPARP